MKVGRRAVLRAKRAGPVPVPPLTCSATPHWTGPVLLWASEPPTQRGLNRCPVLHELWAEGPEVGFCPYYLLAIEAGISLL